jgi:ribosomal protein S18 acetylase RimI-like enzyme
MTASLADGRAAALAFLRSLDDACAERLVPIPGGHAVLDARHPLLWDANHLRVEASEAPDGAALVAEADRHLGALGFRAILVLDPAVADLLAAPLLARGFREQHELLMLLGPTSDVAGAPVEIEEIAGEVVAASRIAAARELLGSAQVGRQLASRDALIAAVTDVRSFAVLAGGTIVARCQVYGARATAQVENVYTDPAHRRRGLAGSLVAHAAREARADGAEVVFLQTDASGPAQRLYRRLGFVDAGPRSRFHRL